MSQPDANNTPVSWQKWHAAATAACLYLVAACGNPAKIDEVPQAKFAAASNASGNSSGTNSDGKADAKADPARPFACSSKEVCPQAALDYVYTGFADPSGKLTGSTGSDVKWAFRAVDHNTLAADQASSSRQTVIFVTGLPASAATQPAATAPLANTLTVGWAPEFPTEGSLVVVVRDYERCLLHETQKACNAPAVLKPYDKSYGPVAFLVEAAPPAVAIDVPAPANGAPMPSMTATAATTPAAMAGTGMTPASPAPPMMPSAGCKKGIFGSILSGVSGGLLGNGVLGCLL